MTHNQQFVTAAINGELETMEALYAQNPDMLMVEALEEAASHGHEAVVVYLLSLRPSGGYGNHVDTTYVAAAESGHVGLVAILEPHREDESSRFEAMEKAVRLGRIDVVRLLKTRHADWNFNILLVVALLSDQKKLVSLLMSWGATYAGALLAADRHFDSDDRVLLLERVNRRQ
jgi:hypothetical protein